MTTATTNTPISHADDAGFRAWGSELSGMLADVGLVQTADTGQIDWTTVTRPGTTNAAAGYEIWEWSDTLQDTAPVVMKIEYGTGSSAAYPCAWLTVGTGSDGAGNITGASVDRAVIRPGQGTTSSILVSSNCPSYVCHADGFLGVVFKGGASTSGVPVIGVFVSRPLDSAGNILPEGVCVTVTGVSSSSGAKSSSVSFATSTQYGAWSRDVAMVPMGVTASLTGTDYQVIRNIAAFPRFRTLAGQFTYIDAEIAQGAMPSVAVDGSTARTFLCLGSFAPYAATQSTSTYRHAMLWE